MKFRNLLLLGICLLALEVNAQVWFAKNAKIRFFSTTPLEDIEAVNDYAAGAINAKTGKVFFKAMMKSFKFEKPLMQEHFNENYVESHKYPSAEFDGMIQDLPDLSVDGTYFVVVRGNMTMHGASVVRDIKVTLVVKDNNIEAKSFFKVPCHDHNIQIPKVSRKNISDDIEVTLTANFIPKN